LQLLAAPARPRQCSQRVQRLGWQLLARWSRRRSERRHHQLALLMQAQPSLGLHPVG
jgi:hypothetical protein